MSKKPRSIRRQAFEELQYPEVTGTRCIEIRIPDSDEYLAQLAGLLTIATQQFQYHNKDTAHASIIAQQWKDAYAEIDWEQCMNCEDVQLCIEEHEGTQNAINNVIANYLTDHPAGSSMPQGERDRTLANGFNPSCDLDIVWSQSVGIVERINQIIEGILESLSEVSTIAGVANVIASLPGAENLGISSITDLATLLVEIPLISYQDDYNITWYEALECEIFCLARTDCVITFDMFWNILKDRVETEIPTFIPPQDFTDVIGWASRVISFLEDFTAIDKADLMFYFILGGVAYGNVILNQLGVGQKAFDVALMLAADEPSNNWEVICLTCPDYEDIVYEANPIQSGLTLATDDGQFLGGDNRIVIAPHQANIALPVNRRIHNVAVIMADAAEFNNKVIIETVEYELVRGTWHGGTTYTYSVAIPDIYTDELDFQFVYNTANEWVILSGVNSFVLNVWSI